MTPDPFTTLNQYRDLIREAEQNGDHQEADRLVMEALPFAEQVRRIRLAAGHWTETP